MGMSLESVIGHLNSQEQGICIVSEVHLRSLIAIANERFEENSKRIERFRKLLKAAIESDGRQGKRNKDGEEWEDKESRRERKRAEGLKVSRELLAGPETVR